MKRFALLTLVALAACNTPTDPITKPNVEFTGFVNTLSGVTIPANSNIVPANFVAQIRSSITGTTARVNDVQCFNGSSQVTPATPDYRTECVFSGVTNNSVIKAAASSSDGSKGETTRTVTVDSIAPVASSLTLGSTSSAIDNSGGAIGLSQNATVNLDSIATFKIVSSDADALYAFIEQDGKQIVQTNGNMAQASLAIANTTPFNVTLGIVDKAGNISKYSVLVKVTQLVGDGVPPLVNISSITPSDATTTPPTVKDIITVVADASDAGGIAKVTLIANNNPVQTNTAPINGKASFSVDTTLLDNGSLQLQAIAEDKSGLTTTSTAVVVTVNNVLGPILSISSPSNGAKIGGFVPVTVNVRKRKTDFTYAAGSSGNLVVQFIDYRGSVALQKIISLAGTTGDTQVFVTDPYDLSPLPNDEYTIKAQVVVNVAGVLDTLIDTVNVTNLNTSLNPPAAVILTPTPLNELQTILPVFRQKTGYLLADISDDTGIVDVELRMTCKTCGTNGPVNALEQYIAYNPPVTKATAVLNYAQGTPFLPDGDYTMRLVVQDKDKQRNIQEINVTLGIAAPYTSPFPAIVPNCITGTDFKPENCTFPINGLDSTHNYLITSWVVSPTGQYSFYDPRNTSVSGQTTVSYGANFNATGQWRFLTQILDLTANRADNLQSGVSVTKP